MKTPAFQFYTGDWMKDPALRSCGPMARGVWVDLLCLMHDGDERGVLSINGKPVSLEQIARMTGATLAEIRKAMVELENAGVFSRNEAGAILSRRMVRDTELLEIRRQGGHLGGEHGVKGKEYGSKGAEHGKKGGRPKATMGGDSAVENPPDNDKITPPSTPPSTPPPSSSSSSSSSEVKTEDPPTPQGGARNFSRQKRTKDPNEPPKSRAPQPIDPLFEVICGLVGDANRNPHGSRIAKIAHQMLDAGLTVEQLRTLPEVVGRHQPFRKVIDLNTVASCWPMIQTPPTPITNTNRPIYDRAPLPPPPIPPELLRNATST